MKIPAILAVLCLAATLFAGEDDAKAKAEKKSLAEFKQSTLDNLASIKEMFAKAEEGWKNKKYLEASMLYSSVAKATVPGSEQMAETSRGRLIEAEDIAKEYLKAADDADIRRDYLKELDALSLVAREFPLTATHAISLRRLLALKSKPDIAALVDFSDAQQLESDGRTAEAYAAYKAIVGNARYEGSLGQAKARKRLEEMPVPDKAKKGARP